ncbi:MAG: PTS glucitol/sorbitol transporter subunit IIA [Christensenella sp.]|uniref:PTS glucitol/sorbitol transporter subunit IIA n=1 Tax=Christensenella sp. TaxID=1935934 RepID=UPI002B20BDF9|nr:PTS glucitol/sorbitol transporter subunit IIA [Christensenella sp.]MEA5002818.1 PTS glucitol/sorbitol transporter subunit IIA [Christensenella sp.]
MFKTDVVDIGPLVQDLAEEGGFIIVFNDNAPAALAEMAVLHTKCELERDVAPGDQVILGNSAYRVTAVGAEANHTLASMGHCTLKFSGYADVELPGQMELDGGGIVPEIQVGDSFEIHFQ